MAKHIIFLVHGVGDTQRGWSLPAQNVIREAYAQYHRLATFAPFDQFFEFKELFWDDHFEALRTQWKNATDSIIADLGTGGLPKRGVTKLTKWASEAGKDSFFTTSALDVVMYRFSLSAEQVRSSIHRQILDTLAAAPAGDMPRWSIIAHSLGTAITHDVLHQMFTPNKPPGFPVLPAGTFRPRVLMMCANVSRLLENKSFFGPNGDVFRSATRPSADPSQGCCDFFINVRHEFDPIPKPKLFRPTDDWPDMATRNEGRYISVIINAIEDKHVHGLHHYLHNPKTHIPLFRLLTTPGLLDANDETVAIANFEANTPLAKFANEASRLEALSLAEADDDWARVLQMVRDYLADFAV